MTLNLGLRRSFRWQFIIADIQSAIIGADFLTHFGLLIDLRTKRLTDSITDLASHGSISAASIHSVAVVTTPAEIPDGELGGKYLDLFQEFADLCSPDITAASAPDLPVFHMITTKGPPVFERPRRLTGDRLEAAKREFQRLEELGIVRRSNSQWASPIHMVPKSDGSWRITGDYKRLNACTQPDHYPIPIVDDLLLEVKGRIFAVIDLRKAFYQIPIAESDIPKTAVTTPFGLYEFLRSSMGLRNAAQSLQRFMDHLLSKLPFAKCYLDDIIH